MGKTKEDILLTALRLFARDGYEATSTGAIAGALGMTKAALYKHYQNKRDIFDHIVMRMEELDADRAREQEMPEDTLEKTPEAYRRTTMEAACRYSKAQFDYWTGDEFAACFRRLLTLEQYRSGEMSGLYQQYLAAGPLGYMTDLFAQALGRDRQEASALAAEFYGPMFLFYAVYDGAEDPAAVRVAAHGQIDRFFAELEEKQ